MSDFSKPQIPLPNTGPSSGPGTGLLRLIMVLALLFIFLVGIKGLGDGFKVLGKDMLDAFFKATSNPFIALMVGILGTTLVQSSSVSTSMVVGLVAAPENPLPIANAIPMIMGANIGTTVTNSIVSLAHMARRDEFRRAFAAATCHDFFNFISVAIFLPLELATGFLSKMAVAVVDFLGNTSGIEYKSPLKVALSASFGPIKSAIKSLSDSVTIQGTAMIIVSGFLIVTALFFIVRVMRSAVQNRVEGILGRALKINPVLAIFVGAIITLMVQSSSITTSLLVPLAGAGVITLRQAFPITIGANIGTTVTALLASLAVSGPNASAGLTIAVIHLLFNAFGTLLIYPIPAIRRIPILAAEKLADIAVNSRQWAVVYVIALFYGLPAVFAFLDKIF